MECKINNISINYEEIGEGKPIIMLHGFSPDHRLMIGCMEPIFRSRDGYRRIYIDLPGMGKSESAEGIINADAMLDIIIEFINKIIPDENFILVGESYGGYLSRGIIYKMADRVEGLLLTCPVIIADYNKRTVPEPIVLINDQELLHGLTPEEVEDFSSMAVVQSKHIYERYKNEIVAGIKLADNIFLERFKENGYGFSFDVDKLGRNFTKPVLLLLGRQDSIVGYEDAWNILRNFTRATFAVLDRAGHNLQIEQEELHNSLVSEWLNRVDEIEQFKDQELLSKKEK
ncbi:alpha/beta hydrolase [Viridibacillus sp. YIM B01967]|uniref:Alpha/beta hydrolase n=1 Tax=Viridibacillus soli TaxID=2798301 RepID=A0ABS1H6X4_9BACL|nr:alpha/beta hydrolase [Viridibacillus soli]MBK3495151.1 alpha/beta hydrolase [Viridibacillus soli]